MNPATLGMTRQDIDEREVSGRLRGIMGVLDATAYRCSGIPGRCACSIRRMASCCANTCTRSGAVILRKDEDRSRKTPPARRNCCSVPIKPDRRSTLFAEACTRLRAKSLCVALWASSSLLANADFTRRATVPELCQNPSVDSVGFAPRNESRFRKLLETQRTGESSGSV